MDDPIERQDAIDAAKRVLGDHEITRTVQTALHILPSALPETQLTAEFIRSGSYDFGICSKCKKDLNDYVVTEDYADLYEFPNFCPNCGAKFIYKSRQ